MKKWFIISALGFVVVVSTLLLISLRVGQSFPTKTISGSKNYTNSTVGIAFSYPYPFLIKTFDFGSEYFELALGEQNIKQPVVIKTVSFSSSDLSESFLQAINIECTASGPTSNSHCATTDKQGNNVFVNKPYHNQFGVSGNEVYVEYLNEGLSPSDKLFGPFYFLQTNKSPLLIMPTTFALFSEQYEQYQKIIKGIADSLKLN
jgi:hypothetical protein